MLPAIFAISLKGAMSEENYKMTVLSSKIFCTLFVWCWDNYMDWGLLRGTQPGRKLLRDQLTFAPSFYYTCIVLNTLFRFYWVLPMLVGKTDNEIVENLELFIFGSMMVEAVRRTFWAIIRVENESFNNFEQYRTIVAIPPMSNVKINKDDDEDD